MDNKGIAHTRWNCTYHIVFIPKYRRKIMYVAIAPKLSVSEFMSYLKGKSALMIFDRHPEYRAKWGDRHFRARGYYVATVGNVNEETYIRCLTAISCAKWQNFAQRYSGLSRLGNKRKTINWRTEESSRAF